MLRVRANQQRVALSAQGIEQPAVPVANRVWPEFGLKPAPTGMIVTYIEKDSIAAGRLQTGDLFTAINGESIAGKLHRKSPHCSTLRIWC